MNSFNKKLFSILLFDDDIVFYNLFKTDLQGFSQLQLLSAYNPLENIEFKLYDAILVDLDIGNHLSGEDLILYLKDLNLNVPLIVLSADENLTTKLRLLKLGIDDYLWKSMHKEEIKIRIQNAILRRKNIATISLGSLSLTRTLDLVLDESKVESSKIEYKFLDLIISRYPRPTSTSELQLQVWNQDHVNKGTINTLVWNLNRKLINWNYRISFQQDVGILLSRKELP
jgi:DNA-binding response OmpR family regulator